jgi:hypothetical protein
MEEKEIMQRKGKTKILSLPLLDSHITERCKAVCSLG